MLFRVGPDIACETATTDRFERKGVSASEPAMGASERVPAVELPAPTPCPSSIRGSAARMEMGWILVTGFFLWGDACSSLQSTDRERLRCTRAKRSPRIRSRALEVTGLYAHRRRLLPDGVERDSTRREPIPA
jgi:hypothetical protein